VPSFPEVYSDKKKENTVEVKNVVAYLDAKSEDRMSFDRILASGIAFDPSGNKD